ncbi:MAG: mechanosensitive ion channel [Aliiglaciecola sp.]
MTIDIAEEFTAFLPLIISTFCVGVGLWMAHHIIIVRFSENGNEKLFSRQLIMLGLTLVSVLIIILSLPISESSRNQVIALVGLVISGIFAFSSSTIFANLLAGIMLRITKPFRTGDFVKVQDNFGRVVERGLLDTEIQTEGRDLVSIPNTYLITHPVTVTRTSGTIVSTTLSLGYDLSNSDVEKALLEAATNCGLVDAFVQIIELGDFSVTYKISGKLEEIKNLISARSALNKQVLDVLHSQKIEIMSPTFVNQRRLAEDFKVIPAKKVVKTESHAVAVEDVAFDKAEEAEKNEQYRLEITSQIEQMKESLREADEDQKVSIKSKIDALETRLKQTKSEVKEG